MAFFRRNEIIESKFSQLHHMLKASFWNVKQDTSNIFKWLNYLYQKSIQQEQQLNELKTELSLVPKTKQQLKQIIDEFYSYEAISKRIDDFENIFTYNKKPEHEHYSTLH